MINKIAAITKRIPREVRYILTLFLTTRMVLTIVGVVGKVLIQPYNNKYTVFSKNIWLNVWGAWDSGWYLHIAKEWYPKNADLSVWNSYGFFPFYPALIKFFNFFVREYFLAGLIISSLSFIIAAFFFYKLVKLDYDEETALRSVKYLFIFPSAFIFSGVFNESLYFMLIIICFYALRKEHLFFTGISGFFLALTKSMGVLIIVPLLYEYFRRKGLKFRPGILFLLLIPFGTFIFSAYCHYLTGDWLAYVHSQASAWGAAARNPFINFYQALLPTSYISVIFPAYFTLFMIVLLLFFLKKLGFSYGLFAFYSIFFPLSCYAAFSSMLRYLIPVFPLYMIFAILGRRKDLNTVLTIVFLILQGFLMIFWNNAFDIII